MGVVTKHDARKTIWFCNHSVAAVGETGGKVVLGFTQHLHQVYSTHIALLDATHRPRGAGTRYKPVRRGWYSVGDVVDERPAKTRQTRPSQRHLSKYKGFIMETVFAFIGSHSDTCLNTNEL